MKLPIIFAALALTAVPAVAQMETTTTTTERHVTRSEERHDSVRDDARRGDQDRRYGHVRRVCKWHWQGHRRVRVCRTVRWH
ncbi:hypothetical protein ACLB0R_14730 [Sphingomonas sp. GlSt437]|uniref:hypothetical protein n=1 Tax=Sphingomonas sp. GlSt437 TaxID=3389970 RepID=UPI003A8A433B